jgi:acyl-CoA reductase-like NAD-dependent aldehyde dehydrogenase
MYQNLIAGEWVASSEATTNINPSDTGDIVGQFARATTADLDRAVVAARAAAPRWAAFGPVERHDVLRHIARTILDRSQQLGKELSREQGKTLAEGQGEAERAGRIFEFYAGECLRADGLKVPSVRSGVEVEVTREPVGVVGIITPWNFPLAIPAWKIAPALAWGNTVIFKPADLVPHSAYALAQIIAESALPAGVFNLVMGSGRVVGEAMLHHPGIDAISFTGSQAIGLRVAQAAAARLPIKKIQLELGGKNPLIVLDDADLGVAVGCSINGAFYSTGQRCTASSRLIVTEPMHDRFVAAMVDAMRGLRVGHALDPATTIGPVVDERQLKQDLDYLALGTAEGARLVIGGERLNRETPGYFLAPALFTEATNAMRISREEIFGPIASVIRVKDYEEAVAVANDTEFGLSSGICTTSLKHAAHFRRASTAGMVMVNLPTAGVDYHVPFGGRRASSHGSREQGRAAIEFYTATKTAYIRP